MNKKVKFFVFLEVNDEKLRYLPKQAIDILTNHKLPLNKEISELDVKKEMNRLADEGKLITRQEPMRIFTYYRPRMLENELLMMKSK